jgi:hypothetical protein
MFEEEYSANQIRADLAFLRYTIQKNQVPLRNDTGLQKLIDECQHFLNNQQVTQEEIKPVTVLFTLVHSLKKLWLNDVDFTIQLRAMNTGTFEYGNPDPDLEHFFKDFEFEIFSASHLINNGIAISLPQHTVGEDLQFNAIDIQCKHPNSLNQVEQNIRDFTSRLNTTRRYGVFGLAVDDCFNYAQRLIFRDEADYNQYFEALSLQTDITLQTLFRDSLARSTRVLGIYLTATFFVLIDNRGLRLVRLTNSAFCFRPDRREINDGLYKEAYKVITKFNPQPAWLTIENQALIAVN